MSQDGAHEPVREPQSAARLALEEQVRHLGAPPFADGSYYLGDVPISDKEYEEFLAQHYADRREGIA